MGNKLEKTWLQLSKTGGDAKGCIPLFGFEMENGCQDPHSPAGILLTSSSSEDRHHVMYHQNFRKVAPEVLRKNPDKSRAKQQ